MAATSGIHARESDYLERYVQIGIAAAKVVSVSFPRSPDEDARPEHPLLERIGRYLAGETDDFADVEIGLTVPTEERSVLQSVRGIPNGEQVAVESLSGMVPHLTADDPEDQELVRRALAENPLPLVVPDHRVLDGPSGAPPEVEQRLRSLEGL
ncbi:MAG: methylated-DNA--[protein]-cysteine S-methyltransferase [Halobacteriales archaeon]